MCACVHKSIFGEISQITHFSIAANCRRSLKVCNEIRRQRKRLAEHIYLEIWRPPPNESALSSEVNLAQLRWKVLYTYIFFALNHVSFNKYISMMNLVAEKSTMPWNISTARIFYCSHFSINLITRRFVIIGAWKNKFNFFSFFAPKPT